MKTLSNFSNQLKNAVDGKNFFNRVYTKETKEILVKVSSNHDLVTKMGLRIVMEQCEKLLHTYYHFSVSASINV